MQLKVSGCFFANFTKQTQTETKSGLLYNSKKDKYKGRLSAIGKLVDR